MTEEQQVEPRPQRKWFAPPSGGYRGLSSTGHVVERPAAPPSVPAMAPRVPPAHEKQADVALS